MTSLLLEPLAGFSGTAYGSLLDIARLLRGKTPADVCDLCSTINMGSARLCKCCQHKLPAYYARGAAVDATQQRRPWHLVPAWTSAFE